LQATWPGLAIEDSAAQMHIAIPNRFCVGHEAHFAQVTNQFFDYLKSPATVPA